MSNLGFVRAASIFAEATRAAHAAGGGAGNGVGAGGGRGGDGGGGGGIPSSWHLMHLLQPTQLWQPPHAKLRACAPRSSATTCRMWGRGAAMATEAAAWNDAQRNVADASMCTGIVASRQVWCVNRNAMAPRTSRKHTPVVLARVAVGRAGGLVTVAVVRLGVRAAVVQRRRGNRRGIGHRVRHEQRHEASHRPVLVLRKASATAARRRRAPRARPSCQCVSSFEGTLASKHRGAARRRRRASWRRRRSGNGPAPSMIPVRGSARRPLAIDQGRQGSTLSFGQAVSRRR